MPTNLHEGSDALGWWLSACEDISVDWDVISEFSLLDSVWLKYQIGYALFHLWLHLSNSTIVLHKIYTLNYYIKKQFFLQIQDKSYA